MVSVGIPTYNNPVGLVKSVNSLINQDYSNLQIIISDNNSTNYNILEMLAELLQNHKQIKVVQQTTNIGVIKNFKFVLNQAEGEYFMWAADDDFWSPNYISSCLNVFSSNPDCVSVFSHFEVLNLKTNEITQKNTPTSCSSSSQFIRVFTRLFEMIPNMIYGLHKTEIIRKISIETFDWFDVLVTIQLAYHGKILIIPQNLYSVGIDGPRKPYSLTGKYLTFKIFRRNMVKFINKRFPFRHRIILLLYTFYVSIKAEKKFRKVIAKWPDLKK